MRGEQVSGEYKEKSALIADGWFPTRDAGYMDEDGYIFLSGRADDVIVRGGENMSPGEIEDVLLTHPAIADACACAVPSVEWGEAVGVALVLRDGHLEPDEDEIKELIRARLRSSRVPERIAFRQGTALQRNGQAAAPRGQDASLPTDGPPIPLARWAGRQLAELARETGSARIAALDGATLLGERGSHGGYTIKGRVSAGLGGSRLLPTRDGGWFALTLIRARRPRTAARAVPRRHRRSSDDHRGDRRGGGAPRLRRAARARPRCSACRSPRRTKPRPRRRSKCSRAGPHRAATARPPPAGGRPVGDLGGAARRAPAVAGGRRSGQGREPDRARPDPPRRSGDVRPDQPGQGQRRSSTCPTRRRSAALIALIRRADFVIESSRVRALLHLGIDADGAGARDAGPGLAEHHRPRRQRRGGGLGRDRQRLRRRRRAQPARWPMAAGEIGYVGDALPDPLTGITARAGRLARLPGGRGAAGSAWP